MSRVYARLWIALDAARGGGVATCATGPLQVSCVRPVRTPRAPGLEEDGGRIDPQRGNGMAAGALDAAWSGFALNAAEPDGRGRTLRGIGRR